MNRVSDVLVVGGGVIGGAIAWALAKRGVSVTVVEAGPIGRGASWAAAGVLCPDWHGHDPAPLTALAEASLASWPEWVSELEDRTGVGLGYRRDGLLNLWVDPEAAGLPPELATTRPPVGNGQILSATEVRRLEPSVTGPILGGILNPDDAQVDNPRLAPTLMRAAADLGVRVLTDTPVATLLGSRGVCRGVKTASGIELTADAVVIATGAWSGLLASASGIHLPMEPWRGQMLAFEAPARPLGRIVFCGELVLVPRPHGSIVVGTTLENVGFDARVTLAGLQQISARACRVVPALGDLRLEQTWAGLRPGTPDHLPYLGSVPGWDGLYVATGHGRKGLILAPITGDLMTRLILERDFDPMLEAFSPQRVLK
jgi:glycine oxidase